METLSTSVSTSPFRPSALHHPTIFKPPSSSSNLNPHLLSRRNSSNQPQTQTLINLQRPTSSTIQQNHTVYPTPSQTQIQTPSKTTRAASGYAAALLDISLCHNTVHMVFKDVTRLVTLIRAKPVLELMRNPFVNVVEKNKALKEMVENGKFEKHLSALVKMLIAKNKFGIAGDVLHEFRGMYYELCDGNKA